MLQGASSRRVPSVAHVDHVRLRETHQREAHVSQGRVDDIVVNVVLEVFFIDGIDGLVTSCTDGSFSLFSLQILSIDRSIAVCVIYTIRDRANCVTWPSRWGYVTVLCE